MIVYPYPNLLPDVDANGNPKVHFLNVGSYSAPGVATLRAAIAAGVNFDRDATLEMLDDYGAASAALKAALLTWVRPAFVNADGSSLISTAYGVDGGGALSYVTEKPLQRSLGSGRKVFDFWNGGDASLDQASVRRAQTVSGAGLTIAVSGQSQGAVGALEVPLQQLSNTSTGYSVLALQRSDTGMITLVGKRANADASITLSTTTPWPTSDESIVIGTMNLNASGTDALTLNLYLAGKTGAATKLTGTQSGALTAGSVAITGHFSVGNVAAAAVASRWKGTVAEALMLTASLDGTNDALRAEAVALMQKQLAR
ncbi:hypothetical protein [Novosphingobium sp. ST904]|uniref:hypothetical protein n=1 Tax=Novosphingobium sp. ST904 TaxID=1684385 RepID=UPI001042D0BA|nr:hypothetical protein [Novosphingobium sp. ST904]TCM25696.1 hypothetical protein EDF59_1398 [Novosphingobium sp. ST904]